MINTAHPVIQADRSSTCSRRLKTGYSIEVNCPPVIIRYRRHMQWVDRVDQGVGYFGIRLLRLHRWWLNVLFWLFEIMMGNGRGLYNELQTKPEKRLNNKDWKYEIVNGLLEWHGLENPFRAKTNPVAKTPVAKKRGAAAAEVVVDAAHVYCLIRERKVSAQEKPTKKDGGSLLRHTREWCVYCKEVFQSHGVEQRSSRKQGKTS